MTRCLSWGWARTQQGKEKKRQKPKRGHGRAQPSKKRIRGRKKEDTKDSRNLQEGGERVYGRAPQARMTREVWGRAKGLLRRNANMIPGRGSVGS